MNKNAFFRGVVMVIVFIATVLLVNRINNTGIDNLTAEMDQPTLPLAYIKYDDQLINCMHGYKSNVDISLLRDTITPLDKEKKIEVWVDQGKKKVDGLTYELRAIEDNSLVEEGEITDLSSKNGYQRATIELRMDIEQGREYMLVIKLSKKDKLVANYYTRVIYEKAMHTKELLETVTNFNDGIFGEGDSSAVATKIEPDPKGNNEDLSSIDVKSSYETMMWAGLTPMKITEAIPEIVEIDDNFACIKLSYVISSNVEGSNRNYLVVERYRVRWVDEDTIYLVDYNRQQEELFVASNVDITKNRFRLGIVDDDNFEYVTSDNDKKVAFIEGGQLWYYDYENTAMARVFGFWQDIYTDERTMYNQNQMDIITLDDKGNILFTVYGYMNRGDHEGELGIAIYKYEVDKSRVSELAFLESDMPFDMLEEYASKLVYMTGSKLYYTMNDSIYCMNINTKKVKEIAYGVPNELIAVSDNKKYIAYPNGNTPEDSTSITLMNLDTEDTSIFDTTGDERIKALGFIEDDFIYGIAKKSDIITRKDGEVVFPMSTVYICDFSKKIVKEYSKSGNYIQGISVDGNVVYLDRLKKTVGDYEETDSDFVSYKENKDNKISLIYKYSEIYYNQLYMVFPSNIYVKTKPKLLITEENLFDSPKSLELDSKKQDDRYYLFADGIYLESYNSSQSAIREANGISGLVTTSSGEIIWRKTTLEDYNTVAKDVPIYTVDTVDESLNACIYMMASYEGMNCEFANMEEDTPNNMITRYVGRTGVNMSGNLLDVGLYYLCADVPFIVKYTNDTYVLVTSFNASSVRYIDPLLEVDVKVDRAEFEANMATQGNVMYSYVPEHN